VHFRHTLYRYAIKIVPHPHIIASTDARGMADSKMGNYGGLSINVDKTGKESRGRARVKES